MAASFKSRQSFTVPATSGNYAPERLTLASPNTALAPASLRSITAIVEPSGAAGAVAEIWLLEVNADPTADASYTNSGLTMTAGVQTWALASYPGAQIRVKSAGTAGTTVVDASGDEIGGAGSSGTAQAVAGSVSVSNFPATQPTSAADGSHVVIGALADAAVVGDNSGSLSAKLRGISKILNDVWASASHWLQVQVMGGENAIGLVGGHTSVTKVALTVNAAAYVAGNNVGGLLDLGTVMRVAAGTGVLLNVAAIEHGGTQKAPLDILIFSAQPAATFTDHAAFPALSLADSKLVIARVSVAAADYVSVGGVATAIESGNSQALKADAGQHLYAAINTSGTPTFAATTDLNLAFGISLD